MGQPKKSLSKQRVYKTKYAYENIQAHLFVAGGSGIWPALFCHSAATKCPAVRFATGEQGQHSDL